MTPSAISAHNQVATSTPKQVDYKPYTIMGAAITAMAAYKMWQGLGQGDPVAINLGVKGVCAGIVILAGVGLHAITTGARADKENEAVVTANKLMLAGIKKESEELEETVVKPLATTSKNQDVSQPFTEAGKIVAEVCSLVTRAKAYGQLLKGNLSGSWISKNDKLLKEAIGKVVKKCESFLETTELSSYEELKRLIIEVECLIAQDVDNGGNPIRHGISKYTYNEKINEFILDINMSGVMSRFSI